MAELTRDGLRANLLPYTDRALSGLRSLEGVRVLDIGCGTGVPTLRIAARTGCRLVGVDPDIGALATLRSRARASGLGERLAVCAASASALPFRAGCFDLVWCEGALFVLGFRESLAAWRPLLRPGGVLVAHDEAGDVPAKTEAARSLGYEVMDVYVLPRETWWDAYYRHAAAARDLEPELEAELEQFREAPERFESAFFVLRAEAR